MPSLKLQVCYVLMSTELHFAT